ncbi:MAG: BamA/TamA family outer membrane protein, partial [Paludibacteraceae bacterium]|nr:BamA/TamA family outer membrane protein [Paludibacteraceae bacterium]
VTGTVLGLAVVVLVAVGCVLYVTPVRQAVVDRALPVVEEQTGLDIDLRQLDVSVFHHSPLLLYRAYKGEADLPLAVSIDSLFVGHRGEDTLLCVRSLRLKAEAKTKTENGESIAASGESIVDSLLALPIAVEQLRLEQAVFHSGSMIDAVGIDASVGLLDVRSPELVIAKGQYPLHGLRLNDTYVGIDLRETPPDTTAQDTTPMMMAFDVPDGELRNIHFALTPMDLHVRTKRLSTKVLADVGGNRFDARRLRIDGASLNIGDLSIPIDSLQGDACVDLDRNLITSKAMYVRSNELDARARLSSTKMNLSTMLVETEGEAAYQGNEVRLSASYDIDDEAYDATVHIDRVNLSPFVPDLPRVVLRGDIEASGQGINPQRPMSSKIKLHLAEARYDTYNLSRTSLEASIDSTTSLALNVPGLKVDFASPMSLFSLIDSILPLVETVSDSAVVHALTSLEDLTVLDTIRQRIPAMQADITLQKGSPIQAIIDDMGLDIHEVSLSLRSDSVRTDVAVNVSLAELDRPEDTTALRLPAADASVRVAMTEGRTDVSLRADTRLTDGAMSVNGICSDVALRMDITREDSVLHGDGELTLDSIAYYDMALGNSAIDIRLSSSDAYAHALRAEVSTEEIPLDIIDGFVELTDIALRGALKVGAAVDGLPQRADVSAEVLPIGVRAEYQPLQVAIGLGETPIVMEHNHIDFNGLPVYGVDSTYLSLSGGLDLDKMRLDITLEADSFAPVKLTKGGPIPVYGELATDLHGSVTGPLDSIVAELDLTLLPVTDITYPIDKKNLAQVKPHGTVSARYDVATGDLALGGQINVDDGFVRYSPKAYPIMPFHVDSGSHVAFNGPIDQTELAISASQQVKADVQSEGEETRRVDFRTGVRVNGVVDSIGIGSIGFFLEAPEDEEITRELASLDEDTRDGLAATLLATGMYVGESNVAAQREGYALSSIINSRLNAAMSNSKLGKVVDIDLSSAQTEHAGGKTNDMNIAISKSFFKDRLRITVGSTLTDNPEINQASGLLNNMSAEYKLTKKADVFLRLFAQRDYNNILEGELYKSGLGVRALKEWRRRELFRADSITRTYNLTADADIAYRSNNSLGPNLTLTHSIKNLFGNGETFSLKGNGAYYWALRNRHPGDPKKTDTYKLGATASLIFPYLHWVGDNNPDGDTRYMLGYQYENIAGGYGVHKMSGSFTYFIKSSPYVTHAFTPFSLSVVLVKAESDSLLDKAAEYPQLIKVLASNEFVPSIGYSFIYNDYRASRHVNTMLEFGVKESGNIINALYCAFGHKWGEQDKKLGSVTFNQFVKLNLELRNKFNITDRICIATRLYAGANIPLGNSAMSPLSEAFYAGGPNGMRAASPYAYGPGNFYSEKYNQNFFHSGDVKLEANFEFRFPIVWKLYGAAFVDAGNVWNWYSAGNLFKEAGITDYVEQLQLRSELYDGIIDNPELLKQIALGTGTGLRLDIDGLVIRLDFGVAIHAPFQTYKYTKDWKPDTTKPINTYFNIPSAVDAIRINFGIGYPF